ncbi:MAG: glycosyltransferase [Chitinivibrionales bacterium]|nr:glycosyltransferase [Chitinivibrionales bacterium]
MAVVMPIYNEEECIQEVVQSWLATLSGLEISFKIIALNDGSKDATLKKLGLFSGDKRVDVINKQNSGHGPTILKGYALACPSAQWVFQCDSDNEMSPDYFQHLWRQRNGYDACMGVRTGRHSTFSRRIITLTSQIMTKLFFGDAVTDVNVPYRLIKSEILSQIIAKIPEDTFAPNVIISGALSKMRSSILQHPVPFQKRKTGNVSIISYKLWLSAAKSFIQTLNAVRKF